MRRHGAPARPGRVSVHGPAAGARGLQPAARGRFSHALPPHRAAGRVLCPSAHGCFPPPALVQVADNHAVALVTFAKLDGAAEELKVMRGRRRRCWWWSALGGVLPSRLWCQRTDLQLAPRHGARRRPRRTWPRRWQSGGAAPPPAAPTTSEMQTLLLLLLLRASLTPPGSVPAAPRSAACSPLPPLLGHTAPGRPS